MATVVENIQNGVRSWIRSMAGLAAAQVIPSSEIGTRPPLPYLTVLVTTHDQRLGEDERVEDTALMVSVTGGVEGDPLVVDVGSDTVTYVRTADDTDATAAAALAVLLGESAAVVSASVDRSDPTMILLVTADAVSLGVDLADGGTAQTIRVRGQRYASVSVQGYDAHAEDGAAAPSVVAGWLQTLEERLGLPASTSALEALELELDIVTPTTYLPTLVGQTFESRYLAELRVSYTLDGARERVDEVAEIVVAVTDSDGTGYTDAQTVTIETGA